MLKKLLLLSTGILIAAAALFAANVWDKPYTEWSEMDRQKVAEDSPWGNVKDRETGEVDAQNAHVKAKGVRMMWESSLPIKQMLMGKTAATDAKVKALLDRDEPNHTLHIERLPGTLKDLLSEKEKVIASTVIKVKGKPDIHPTDMVQVAPAAPKGGVGGFGGPGGKGGAKGGAKGGGAAPAGGGAAPASGDEGFGSIDAGGGAAPGGGGGGGKG